ncbi:exonuclease domain-containing protein [Gordonia sihwensis]|uniref:exonuclease domain-containing protein n=1 Tax=Gordonia sihwensis TaxID=173559 RepID=UPI00069685A7|nr:exonuclease domain-containing protein [Gordonia sihwensis]
MEFVAIDVETANSNRASICAIGWTEIVDDRVASSGSVLCRPPESVDWFEPYLTANVHGISAADVADRPRFGQVWPVIAEMIGDRTVIAHNAPFDVGAVRGACTASSLAWPTLEYGCTLSLSRRLLDLPSHALPIVAEHLGVILRNHHDASADAGAAAGILLALANITGASTVEEVLDAAHCALGEVSPGGWTGPRALPISVRSTGGGGRWTRTIPAANLDADPANPFFGQFVCFTGGLTSMQRSLAWDAVADAGGSITKSTTKKTSILVVGDGFTSTNLDSLTATSKAKKALANRAAGQPIELWDEREFMAAVSTVFNFSADGTLTPIDEQSAPVPQLRLVPDLP